MIRNQLKTAGRASKRIKKHTRKKDDFKAWVQSKITKASDYLDTAADYLDSKDMKKEAANPAQQAAIAINMKEKGKKPKEVSEGSLRNWFKGSKSKDGKGGWVNVVTGGTCASDEPGEGTPKCVSSSKRASMTKAERLSASRRKKKADPGQQSKSGAAKPTYVSTDKKKMKEEIQITEADKKGKGSGTKDACYHKVKSRYSVWPSAYASGALVKCRKVGAANWGNKSEEVEIVDEAMSSYDRNRKAAAKRAAERNRLRKAGKMGGRMENETYRNEAGTRMHHKGYKAEAYVVNQADKTSNTPAYQGMKAGKKNKLTGEPLYKKADNMKENLVTIEKLNNVSNINVKATDYKSEKDTINEILGAALGGAAGIMGAGTAKGAALLGKAGLKSALAQKAAAGAVGSAAGEMLDPTKKAKDKKPLTAAALGGLGGAVAGGGIGKATDALNKKLGIEATPGQ